MSSLVELDRLKSLRFKIDNARLNEALAVYCPDPSRCIIQKPGYRDYLDNLTPSRLSIAPYINEGMLVYINSPEPLLRFWEVRERRSLGMIPLPASALIRVRIRMAFDSDSLGLFTVIEATVENSQKIQPELLEAKLREKFPFRSHQIWIQTDRGEFYSYGKDERDPGSSYPY